MVRPRLVFEGILDELETGDANAVERHVIRATGPAGSDRAGAAIAERGEPAAEHLRRSAP